MTVTPVPTPDFSLSLSPATARMDPDGSAAFKISVSGLNGFTGNVNISVSGLPKSVNANPSGFSIYANSSSQLTLNATSAPRGSTSFQLTGTSGSVTHSVTATIAIPAAPAQLNSRMHYFPMGALNWSTAYGPTVLYNSPSNRFFMINNPKNQLQAFDAKTQKESGSSIVPGAWLLDQSADGSVLYVGTTVGDLYLVDPVSLSVQQIDHTTIGTHGYSTFGAFGLADGRLLLLGDQFAVPSPMGYRSVAIWDRTSNTLVKYVTDAGITDGIEGQSFCTGIDLVGNVSVDPARTHVYFGGGGGGADVICRFDPASGASTPVTIAPTGGAGPTGYTVLPVPDGKTFLTFGFGNTYIWDATSMTQTGQFAFPPYRSAGGAVLSPDGNTLYTGGSGYLLAQDWRAQTVVGWVNVPGSQFEGPLVPMAIDSTGLIAGMMGYPAEDFGFADVADLNAGPYTPDVAGTSAGEETHLPIHTVGPVSGGTTVRIGWAPAIGMYIDGQSVAYTDASDGSLQATAPPHEQGPVDVALLRSTGEIEINFAGFSYGPSVVSQPTTFSTAEGGGAGTIAGYGFYDTGSDTLTPATITVGGTPATLLSVPNGNAPYDSPLQAYQFLIPPGQPGTTAHVTLTTPNGTVTAPHPITYLPAVRSFPLANASLAQGVYDRVHRLYYFADLQKLQVFSRDSMSWQTPIALPQAQELLGVGLSPDSTKMVVSDDVTDVIYVLDTGNPASIRTFHVPPSGGIAQLPDGVAISNQGIVYFGTYLTTEGDTPALHKLDTNTGRVSDYVNGPVTINQEEQQGSRVLMSPDGSTVYYMGSESVGTFLYVLSTASDSVSVVPDIYLNSADIALSPDGKHVAAAQFLLDGQGNPRIPIGYSDYFNFNLEQTPGEKFSADGALLFQPEDQAILAIDVSTGLPVYQVQLPVALALSEDSLVSNGEDDQVVALTNLGEGIVVIDLSALPQPVDKSGVAAARNLGSAIGLAVHPNSSKPVAHFFSNQRPHSRAQRFSVRGQRFAKAATAARASEATGTRISPSAIPPSMRSSGIAEVPGTSLDEEDDEQESSSSSE